MVRPTDLAWAAGFFDGEGCVGINRLSKNGYTYYSFRLKVAQADKATLDHFAEVVGVPEKVVKSVRSRVYKGSKIQEVYWTWEVTGVLAKHVGQLLLPYLVFKRDRMEFAMQFQALIDNTGRVGARGLTAEQREERKMYYDGMRAFNRSPNEDVRAGAETKFRGQVETPACDSPVCKDDKLAELGRNAQASKLAN